MKRKLTLKNIKIQKQIALGRREGGGVSSQLGRVGDLLRFYPPPLGGLLKYHCAAARDILRSRTEIRYQQLL